MATDVELLGPADFHDGQIILVQARYTRRFVFTDWDHEDDARLEGDAQDVSIGPIDEGQRPVIRP